jgi:hypothetical protein
LKGRARLPKKVRVEVEVEVVLAVVYSAKSIYEVA